MEWREIWQRHPGSRCAVIGNGWSLRDVPRETLDGMVTLGVNRAWQWGKLDYWFCIDRDQFDLAVKRKEAWRKFHEWGTVWVVNTGFCTDVNAEDQPDEAHLLKYVAGRIDIRQGHFPPAAVCEEFLALGSFPGQKLKGKGPPKTRTLWSECSSVDRCIHMALLMGAAEVHLYGVDLENDPESGVRHFCTEPGNPQRRKAERGLSQLNRCRRNLEAMGHLWRDDPRKLVVHSPSGVAMNLEHWEHRWP